MTPIYKDNGDIYGWAKVDDEQVVLKFADNPSWKWSFDRKAVPQLIAILHADYYG